MGFYNLTMGGEGNLGYRMSEEARARISKVHLGNKYRLGQRPNSEVRAKMSEACRLAANHPAERLRRSERAKKQWLAGNIGRKRKSS